MNVLVLSNLYPPDVIGGYEIACRQVVDGLIELGHDVRVLTSVPRQPVGPIDHVDRRFRLADEWNPNVMGSHSLVHCMTHAHSRFIDAHNVYMLLQAIKMFQPDVAYLANLVGIGGLSLIATLQQRAVPWVQQLGDCIPNRLCSTRKRLVPELADDYGRRFEGSYIVVSERVRREIEEAGIALRGRVELLPYWITGTRPEKRREFYRGGTLKIMSAGSVNHDKGIGILIDSIYHLHEMNVRDIQLDIYGKANENTFADMIHQYGLEDRVRLLGPKPHRDLLDLYRQYDLFAFATQEREPFGMVPLEAASRGCVPIITRSCGVAEWLVNGVHILKASRNPLSFAETIRDVANGVIDLEPIANRGFQAAWSDFHLDTILPKIEAVLLDAAAIGDPSCKRIPSASPSEVYRMARLAERLAETLIGEAMGALASV